MADYVIGDVQGCYRPLQSLLERLHFNEQMDRLWFVGDLINRGPHSLEVLLFVKNLPNQPRIVLGNHDLHLLNHIFCKHSKHNRDDTLQAVLSSPEVEEIGHWLRKQAILIHDEAFNVVITHAGIAPMWDLTQAKKLASELEMALQGPEFHDFLNHMYGNEPNLWSPSLTGMSRLRLICNYFTRMRFCDAQGRLLLTYKGTIKNAPSGFFPWYEVPERVEITPHIIFGHWAALEGRCSHPNISAIDTGCLWGKELTALRLQDRRRFSVPCS